MSVYLDSLPFGTQVYFVLFFFLKKILVSILRNMGMQREAKLLAADRSSIKKKLPKQKDCSLYSYLGLVLIRFSRRESPWCLQQEIEESEDGGRRMGWPGTDCRLGGDGLFDKSIGAPLGAQISGRSPLENSYELNISKSRLGMNEMRRVAVLRRSMDWILVSRKETIFWKKFQKVS